MEVGWYPWATDQERRAFICMEPGRRTNDRKISGIPGAERPSARRNGGGWRDHRLWHGARQTGRTRSWAGSTPDCRRIFPPAFCRIADPDRKKECDEETVAGSTCRVYRL